MRVRWIGIRRKDHPHSKKDPGALHRFRKVSRHVSQRTPGKSREPGIHRHRRPCLADLDPVLAQQPNGIIDPFA